MIEFVDVKKRFGQQVILDGVNLKARRGEILFVIGTSGVGKSVLVKQVVGLLRPDSGRILVDGVDVTNLKERDFYPLRKKCALVLQTATLFDSMTCLENVLLPLRKHETKPGRSLAAQKEEALRLLRDVGMEDHSATYPAELGDGSRKRVAVARALSVRPEYVLFDEPTTSLDPVSARRVDRLIVDLCRKDGVTAIVVSHDLRSIFSIADRIAMLYKGRVWAEGTPEQLRQHQDPIVAQFISGTAQGPLETT